MNKYIKRLIITLALMLAFGGTFAGGVYASETLHRWAGANNYDQLMSNLDKSFVKWTALKEKKDDLVAEKNELVEKNTELSSKVSSLENAVKGKENELAGKQAEIQQKIDEKNKAVAKKQTELDAKQKEYDKQVAIVQEKQQELDKLNQDKGTSDADLKQAITDMRTAKEKSQDILNKMND